MSLINISKNFIPDITLTFENFEQISIPGEDMSNILICMDKQCGKRITYIEIGIIKDRLSPLVVERLNKRDIVYIDYIDEDGIERSYEVPYLSDGDNDYIVGCAPNVLQEKICLEHVYINNSENDVTYLAIGKRSD